jgi:hypothetical protein
MTNDYYTKKALRACLISIAACFLLELFWIKSTDPLFTLPWHYIVPTSVYSFHAGIYAALKRNGEKNNKISLESP